MNTKPVLFIALFCLALYINSLSGEFVSDDLSFVVENTQIRTLANFFHFFTDPKTAATGQLAGDVYRPLTTLSYAVDYFMWGLISFGYHLTNILLHSANSALVFLLFFLISGNFIISIFGSLIFAAHPAQTEVVCWISGRSSLLFLFFYLLSLVFYIRSSREGRRKFYILSLIFFLLSLFSKEMSVTLPLILILHDLHFSQGKKLGTRILRYVPYFLLSFFYIFLRIVLMKKVGQFEGWGDPYHLFLTMSNVVADYIRILFAPLKPGPPF